MQNAPELTCACFNLRRTARLVTQLYERHLAPTGLKPTQYTVLQVLKKAGPLPLSQAADLMGMDRTTVTRNLGPLERDGLIQIGPGSDRRVRVISLTPKGESAWSRAYPHWESAQRTLTEAHGTWGTLHRELLRLNALSQELAERVAH